MTDRAERGVKPILMSGSMVRASLDGRKTNTRRVLKPQPVPFIDSDTGLACEVAIEQGKNDRRPRIRLGRVITAQTVPYAVGDLLWVRETFYLTDDGHSEQAVYAADEIEAARHVNNVGNVAARHGFSADWLARHTKRHPSIHMPRWASRLTLEVTNVKVERLQDISREDAIAEGIEVDQSGRFSAIAWRNYAFDSHPFNCAVTSFRSLWNSINGASAWDANPWVVALTFTVHKCNVDQLPQRATEAA